MTKNALRVGFLSSQNYLDRNTFSGTLYYMHRALSKLDNVSVVNLGSPWKPNLGWKLLNRISRAKPGSKLCQFSERDNFNKFSSLVRRQIQRAGCDLIFAPVAAEELGCCRGEKPMVYLSDTTFRLYQKYYDLSLSQQEIDFLSQAESRAIAAADMIVYSSEWAANSAVFDYGAAASKIRIIPFGANIDSVPSLSNILQKRQLSTCKLLFIGKEWERKGGKIAYQTLIALLSRGINAELTMIGCIPPDNIQHDRLTVIPYLNKNIPQQRKKLDELFMESNFFILPTRADCSPIVICEANAFALPVLTTDVGGIPSLIQDGKNGYSLPLSASGEEYADVIAKIFVDRSRYEQLLRLSRYEYENRLNWDSWAKSVYEVMVETLNHKTDLCGIGHAATNPQCA